jgi:hypothetical protein
MVAAEDPAISVLMAWGFIWFAFFYLSLNLQPLIQTSQVCQRIHEWRAGFGSTAVSVLMAYFASTPEYKTQEAREEYAEDQLQDCRFVYEDPDNEEQPGAFLSEYILRIFASHLSAISGRVRVDELVEFGKPGYLTALALAAAAVSVQIFPLSLSILRQQNIN